MQLEAGKLTDENVINPSSIYFLVNYLEREVMKIKQAKICVCVFLEAGARWEPQSHEETFRYIARCSNLSWR